MIYCKFVSPALLHKVFYSQRVKCSVSLQFSQYDILKSCFTLICTGQCRILRCVLTEGEPVDSEKIPVVLSEVAAHEAMCFEVGSSQGLYRASLSRHVVILFYVVCSTTRTTRTIMRTYRTTCTTIEVTYLYERIKLQT